MRTTPPILALIAVSVFAGGCASQPKPSTGTRLSSATRPAATQPVAESPGIFDGLTQFIKNLTGDTPGRYAQYTLSDSPDARRVGINGLVERDFGRHPPYTLRYADMARVDSDYLVRAAALRALNRSRDQSATKLFIRGLQDPNVAIRLEACKALLRVPDPDAAEPLLATLNTPEEDKDVRIAAADALRHYKRLDVARALVSMLPNRDFGIAWQSRRSLKYLTGKDWLYSEDAWLTYLTGPEKPFG